MSNEAEDRKAEDRIETFFARAVADASAPAGRFTQQEAVMVTGSAPIPAPLPAPAWCTDPVPQEPPLGVEIDYIDIGEPIAPPEEER